MTEDIINNTLKAYFIKKGKNFKLIQRYLRIKYKLNIEEKLLQKRVTQLKIS
ncbi:hypothetical protein GCM10028791_01110 [Echinicola sediminis]